MFGPSTADDDDVIAVWTDQFSTPAVLTIPNLGTQSLSTVDILDARSSTTLSSAGQGMLQPSAAPQYFNVPAGADVAISPTEPFGIDFALQSGGATATSSSAAPRNPASAAIDGHADVEGAGDWPGSPAWAPAVGDKSPSLSVHLASPTALDRLVISTPSNASVVPGIRDFHVQVRPSSASPWRTIASMNAEVYNRIKIIAFPTTRVSDIRVEVSAVNYPGKNGGAKPWF